jgi:succinate-semialdehyde dehydrogenase/glutarate-semialdehyde dehydrogenase
MSAPTQAEVMIEPQHLAELLEQACVAAGAHVRPVVAPFTGELLVELPMAEEADVEAAFVRARRAQPAWAATPLRQRCKIMLRFHDLVLSRRDELLDLVQMETGKARRDAQEEVLDVSITSRHYARDAQRLLKPKKHRGAFPLMVGVREVHHPIGVVGMISPWNYPLTLAISDAIPALLAGNAVVLKPDVQTTLCSLLVSRLLAEAGLPAGLFQVVPGEGPEVGPMVIDRADYVMFTGSTRVGREVARRCGERLIGSSMELGGKNAMIVRADADLDKASEIATRGSFSNTGQLCISMERIYVHESIYDAFKAKFVERTRALKMKPSVGWGADIGSLISARQRDRVLGHIDDAVSRGATVLAGGKARPDVGPFYVEPTILEGVTEDMILCDEETFGPVVALYPYRTDEEAIAAANDTTYGLNASVVTKDMAEGRRIAARLQSGTVNVNEGYATAWASVRAPMGGMKESGLGRRHGDQGLLKYTESQNIATQRMLGFGAPFGWTDQRWGETLSFSLNWMKKLGLK